MTNRIRVLGLVLALLLIPTATVVAPVVDPEPESTAAAWHGWHQSWCRPDVWYIADGGGWWYWHATYGQHWIGGDFLARYGQEGYECGYAGTVIGQWHFYFPCGCHIQETEHAYLVETYGPQGVNICYKGDVCYD